jgi:F0F1-type ATP synthase membrane subunit b/b'
VTRPDLASPSRSDALVREIERQCEVECRAILEAAELESRAIVADAFTVARRHVHEAFEDLRRDGERRLARAKAQIATELRVRDQARAAGNLRDGCPVLVNAVADRWGDAEARRHWTAALAETARRQLRPGTWIVEHQIGRAHV